MKILFFDVETTCLDPKTCAIHQLAGLVVIDGVVKESFNYQIRPHDGAEVSDESLAISGKSRGLIYSYPSPEEQRMHFNTLLKRYVSPYDKTDKFYLAGYNSRSFDEPFLRAFWTRFDQYYGSYFWQIGFDVMVLAAEHLKHSLPTMPNFKLHTVASQLGIAVDSSRLHDALYDVELTYAIYKQIQKPLDATQLARQVLTTLEAQQNYFQAARTGSAAKAQALERSKALEKSLRQTCEQLTHIQQPTLF